MDRWMGMFDINGELDKEILFLFSCLFLSQMYCALWLITPYHQVFFIEFLWRFGKICYLQYANDLIILMARGVEILWIFKLIMYLFEGILGLAINFHKTCLYSTKPGQLPEGSLSATLYYSTSLLPLTYLGIPISGRCSWVRIGKLLSRKSLKDSKPHSCP